MNEHLVLVLAGLAGVGLGALFFVGLWWTVRRGISSKRPARWFFGSLLLRMVIVLAGFYLIAGGRWERLLACLLGFILVRFIVVLRVHTCFRPQAVAGQAGQVGPPVRRGEDPVRSAKEASDAP